MKNRVCVITGTRAEYGLLRPLIDKLNNDDELELQLVVTGMHLSPEFGLTYKEIEKDEYKIDEKIEVLLSSDTSVGISKSIGLAIVGFADAFERLKPDMVVLLGDRYEIFAAASAAMVARIPIAHLYGGETGAGTIDNMLRHAITKFSLLHFTSSESYRKRVIQLGENPNNVYNVGSLGVENIKNQRLLSKEDLERDLNFHIDDHTILVTYHPLSLEPHLAQRQFHEILTALSRIENLKVIFTKCNSDTGGRIINEMIDNYVDDNHNTTIAFSSLGTLRYLSTAKYVKAVVGNSSSGIIEVPSLNTYTLNIGKRQDGRIQSDSIYNCEPIVEDVLEKLTLIINLPILLEAKNPYEKSNSSSNIISIIKERMLSNKFEEKQFYDIDF
jgi:GDP/UDP-N,N'-diacetylbacillosamine 2-epimerase (hydrolysing)